MIGLTVMHRHEQLAGLYGAGEPGSHGGCSASAGNVDAIAVVDRSRVSIVGMDLHLRIARRQLTKYGAF